MACCRHRKGNSLLLCVGTCFSLSSNTRAPHKFVKVLFPLIAVFKTGKTNLIKISNESVEDLGEGSREPGSPPFLEAKLRSAGPRKIIFETGFPLLHLRNWMSGPGPRLTKI